MMDVKPAAILTNSAYISQSSASQPTQRLARFISFLFRVMMESHEDYYQNVLAPILSTNEPPFVVVFLEVTSIRKTHSIRT
jgi:hypothetical protein